MTKKKFAFLDFHSESYGKIKYVKESAQNEFFPVVLKTDRFLEKKLRDIMKLGQKRPYTLVVDTAGCNRECWFCYAYPILKKEKYDGCVTVSLSPEELVERFVGKLCSLKNTAIYKDRFFSKLRITGGEPLYSTEDTLEGFEGKDYPYGTIDYFLKFFELLDPHICKLIQEKTIHLSPPKKYSHEIPFPTFLCTPDNRIEIRFDTNGFLFGDYNFANKFVGGVYNLLVDSKLNNLLIKIDYSLKGAHPLEADWSQRKEFPVDKDRITDKFDVEKHPQYSGLKNIFGLIQEYGRKNQKFNNCFGITVEPGIHNVKGNFMYYENSMDWRLLEKKLQEKLGSNFIISDVDNKMEIGIAWSKIHTHLKRGVAIKVIHDGKEFVCSPTDSKNEKEELFSLLRKLKGENKKFSIIYIPYKEGAHQVCRQQLLKL